MKQSIEKKIMGGLALAVLLVGVITWVAYRQTQSSMEAARWVTHTTEVLISLADVFSTIQDAETSARGYIITGSEDYLEPYNISTKIMIQKLAHLRSLTSDNPHQQERLDKLEPLIDRKKAIMTEHIYERRNRGLEATVLLVQRDIGKRTMNEIRAIIEKMEEEENGLLERRVADEQKYTQKAILIFFVLSFMILALIALVYNMFKHDIVGRKLAENEVKQTNLKLTTLVEELEVHGREMTLQSEMGELLQTCGTLQEASIVIAKSLEQLFSTESGALYILMASWNLVERTAVWGATPPEERLFPPDECWALRRGQVHSVEDVDTGLVCKHVQQPRSGSYLCIPMQAQNDMLGVLQLTFLKSDSIQGLDGDKENLKITKQKLAVAVAEQIALALSNIKLRETLRSQAIRDSLTGLFNRRYLEETLKQEVSRAERNHQQIGVIMIDIDHFKQYNDVHGHDAGDVVLSALGQFLKEKIRGGDTACRYGGEEFTVVLPGASVEVALQKAKFLCDEVKQIKPLYRGQPLEGITLSLGVSGFPDHGSVGEALLRAADQALYQAKVAGRDRVVNAGLPTRPLGNVV